MADSTKESGLKTIWKAWAFISGTMAESTRGITKVTKNMGMGSTSGLISADMKATGLRANSMGWGPM